MSLFGRNNRRSSVCSTGTFALFVALCVVGAWMMTSSSFFPIGISSENKSEVEQETDRSLDSTNSIKQETPDINANGSGGGDASGEEQSAAAAAAAVVEQQDDAGGKAAGGSESKETVGASDSEEAKVGSSDSEEAKGEETNDAPKALDDGKYTDENGPTEVVTGNSDDSKGDNQEKTDNGGAASVESGKSEPSPETSDQETDVNNNGDNGKAKQTYNDENGTADAGELVKADNDDDNGSGAAAGSNQEDVQYKVDNAEQIIAANSTSNDDAATSSLPKNGADAGDAAKLDELNYGGVDDATPVPVTATAAAEAFPNGQAELLNETNPQNGTFMTQAAESKKEKATRKEKAGFEWKLCNVPVGEDYIPCLDNEAAIKKLRSTKHYEHRERHCPDEPPACLVPLPEGYKEPIPWPHSREKIWFHNVPHNRLASFKGHQNWVKVSGEYLTFPGGGTQFINGALHYIDNIQENMPEIAWGKKSRVVLDVGCGVASFGGFLFDRDVLTMSFAPKDEHEAQVQFALERGIPAISAVMGTKRLPFPSRVFDVVHCARCRVPWHIDGGKLLLELDRLLRPGGFFVWSATPVYQDLEEDVAIWNAMSELTAAICWTMVKKTRDTVNQVGLAIYKKATSNDCYDRRPKNEPPICDDSDDPNASWNISLRACLHRLPASAAVRGSRWPEQWPERVSKAPYWLNGSQVGVYGKPAPEDFAADYEHWKRVVANSYLTGLGIDWSTVRNAMDMRAVYGGFAAALREKQVWVMNVVSINAADTLPIIYERGLFGIYHDWCESFSTYPRSYDLLHADRLFSQIRQRCKVVPVMAEIDRVLRPGGKLIVRDSADTVKEVQGVAKSLHWEIRLVFTKEKEALLVAKKGMWRPSEIAKL